MLQLRPLLLQLRELRLPLLERAVIAAPGEDSVRSGNGMAGEGADDDQRQRGKCRAANKLENALPTPHGAKESRRSHKCKQKEWFGGYCGEKLVDGRRQIFRTAPRDD